MLVAAAAAADKKITMEEYKQNERVLIFTHFVWETNFDTKTRESRPHNTHTKITLSGRTFYELKPTEDASELRFFSQHRKITDAAAEIDAHLLSLVGGRSMNEE